MDGDGYRPMSGHGIIAATTIALERELFFARDQAIPTCELTFDTPAGTVHARAHVVAGPDRLRVDSVRFTNVPAFVHTPGHPVRVGTRALRVDVAFGGVFYAIADTEAVGIPLTRRRLPELRRLAIDLSRRSTIRYASSIRRCAARWSAASCSPVRHRTRRRIFVLWPCRPAVA